MWPALIQHVFVTFQVLVLVSDFVVICIYPWINFILIIYILGFYAFVDSSKSSYEIPDKAIMKSVLFEPTVGVCLSFWYTMYGVSVQSLNVYLKVLSKPSELKWTMFGNQGDQWLHGQIPVISNITYQVNL